MAWFAVDDSFHSHPKRLTAGDAAVGLWTACGSYCAAHLTDGVVPGAVARLYGKPAGVKALVRVRLWHAAGHGCGRCPQPPDGDYVMHDYLHYNPSRQEVEAERRKTHEEKSRAGRAGGIASGVSRRRNGKGHAPGTAEAGTGQARSRAEAEPKQAGGQDRSRTEADTKQDRSRPASGAEAEPKQTRSGTEADRQAEPKQDRSRPASRAEAEPKQTEAPSPPNPNNPSLRSGLSRATRAPASFPLTDRHRAWAQQRDIRVDLHRETERWLDHHRAKGSTFADWEAAWRTWMSRAADYAPAGRQRPAGDPYLNDIRAGLYEPQATTPPLRALPALEAR